MSLEYFILNVFSDRGIDGGNQLAVFPKAQNLSLEQMQKIAKQFNFSESTFVQSIDETEAKVRIFTPNLEIMYAGHPTIGTLNVLETIYRQNSHKVRKHYNLNLQGGRVEGSFYNEPESDQIALTSFKQAPAEFVRIFRDRQMVLNALGISKDNLLSDKPFYVNAVTTMKFLFVPVKNYKVLKELKPNFTLLSEGNFKEDDISIYAFTIDAQDGGNLRGRFFVPLYGVLEDPATGGIQSSFGLCLAQLGLLKDNTTNDMVVEQGYEMGRPSKIYNKFSMENGQLVKTETGGKCFLFSKGVLLKNQT